MAPIDNPGATETSKVQDGLTIAHKEHVTPLSSTNLDSFEAEDGHVRLTWRSWMVVFVTCFAIMGQVFVVVAAGSVIGFIIQDLGGAEIAGWVIQGPLLMQSVLSPIVGRLSDILDRKYLAMVPPLIALVGACVSAKATSMSMLIGGGVLIGTTLSTISIVQAIPSEILPLKFRALANGFAFFGGSVGGILGSFLAGALTNANSGGWRNIFWVEAAFFLVSALGIFCFYWPPKSSVRRMTWRQIAWECDPIGSLLFVSSATLLLLAFDWSAGTYAWSNNHVIVNLVLGLVALIAFVFYEWKGRDDGLVAHVFFKGGPNFTLSVFAFAVEGWIFYSAVNSVTPLMVLNLGFQTNAWRISIRQLTYTLPNLLASIPIALYATVYKDLKTPLLATFGLFLVAVICYCNITPSMSNAQLGFNVITGIGQAGPLTLLVALVQFTAPASLISTATGLAFSARAIGGAFGSAILDTIINSHISQAYVPSITSTAEKRGLPPSSIQALLSSLAAPQLGFNNVAGLNSTILAAVMDTSHSVYAKAYRNAWASIIPFVVLGFLAVFFLKGVEEHMTDVVEAPIEKRAEGSAMRDSMILA